MVIIFQAVDLVFQKDFDQKTIERRFSYVILMKEFLPKFRFLLLVTFFFVESHFLHSQTKTDWFNEDFIPTVSAGAEVDKALLAIGKRELNQIVVAVIDDGVDIDHYDLKGKIWVNKAEIPDNGKDDDGNGYIDDINGWNFLGNPKGENIRYETLEITRLYREYSEKYKKREVNSIARQEKEEYDLYLRFKSQFEEELKIVQDQFAEFTQVESLFKGAQAYYLNETGRSAINISEVENWQPSAADGDQVKIFLVLAAQEGLAESLEDGADYFKTQLDYNLNIDYDPRGLVNEDMFSIGYGNNQVGADDPSHGTHVAGIIAALRDNDEGIRGVAPNALIMPIRAVPAGDERDKDIALAIRYAVDNGAKIINMSFGKNYSPNKSMVEDALRYAIKNNVLLIHAAGNDASDNDRIKNYPDGTLGKKKSAKTLLTVAASNYKSESALIADFSNSGAKSVDCLAPGVDIKSLAPNHQLKSQSGTSMAAPVVAGIAALIWGLDPNLSAKKVKRILVKNVNSVESFYSSSEIPELPTIRFPVCVSANKAISGLLR